MSGKSRSEYASRERQVKQTGMSSKVQLSTYKGQVNEPQQGIITYADGRTEFIKPANGIQFTMEDIRTAVGPAALRIIANGDSVTYTDDVSGISLRIARV